MKLKNKIAIVTGGSQGIGEAICYAYAKEGATVIVVNKNHPENGKKVAQTIQKAGGKAEAMVCDVTQESEVNQLVNQVIQKYGRIDILVHSAGCVVFKSFESNTLEDWDRVLNLNLRAAFLLTHAVIPTMKKQQQGKIILISSISGAITGRAKIVAYCASKGGLLGLAKGLAAEFAQDGINVNVISPGNVKTTINQSVWSDPQAVKAIAEQTPSGIAFMEPEDIAGAAVYLASEEAKRVHGIDLIIDNGFTVV